MADSPFCPKCGAGLPADAPEGVCPACELRGALEADASHPPLSPLEEGCEAFPRWFADYELLEEIARGGMGIVYRARQVSLDRMVAVKLLPLGGPTSPEFIKRFRAEASAAAALRHPNIVAVHEVGVLQGQHYLVMDFVNGPPLSQMIARSPLPARQTAAYLKTVAQAIHHAHERGILHRDLKPSNVLIDEDDQPQVTDFGLAKRIDGESSLTLPGQVLGSPNYMPPEQASAAHGQVTRRSDVYGLGAMLYHALTGRPPFQAATLSESIHQVLNLDPVPPRLLNPGVPRDLETVCLKCLEKEPERRYATAAAVGEELARFLNGEPLLARPVGALGKAWRWCRRKPALAAVGAIAALLLLVLAIGGPIVASRERTAAEHYRRSLYASDLKVAFQAWRQADLEQAVAALDRHTNWSGPSDLREFTWRYLNRLCQPYRQPSLQATNAVIFLATTKDGRLLAASGGFDFVTLWDLEAQTDLPLRQFRAGGVLAGPLSFSPDGRYFVTGGISKERNTNGLQIWDRATWQRVTSLPNLPGRFCDFSPDGRVLAVPSDTHVVLIKVGGDWPELRRLTHHTDQVWSARFSTNGKRLVTGGSDRAARVWDTTSWECIAVLNTNHTDGGSVAVLSPDGQRVATAGGKTVRLWDVDSQTELGAYAHQAEVKGLAFSPDGRVLASGGDDGLVRLWDWQSNTFRELRGHARMVTQVKFVLGGTKLASASWDGMIRLWDVNERPPNDVLEGRAYVSPITFTPNSGLIATVSPNATNIVLWNSETGTIRTNLPDVVPELLTLLTPEEATLDDTPIIRQTEVNDLAFSADGALAAARAFQVSLAGTNSWRSRIEMWDVGRRAMTNSFAGQAPICFAPDGRWFACQGVHQGTIQFRDLETGRAWASLGGFEPSPDQNEFAFSPDGRLLASSGIETVLWETATGRRLATVLSVTRDLEEPIRSVVFTADSRWLIGGGDSGGIQIWDVATGHRFHRSHAHMAGVASLAVSPDGKTLATGSNLGLMKLWRLEPPDGRFNSGWAIRELLALSEHQAAIANLRFSPKGDVLGSSDVQGVVRLWRGPIRE